MTQKSRVRHRIVLLLYYSDEYTELEPVPVAHSSAFVHSTLEPQPVTGTLFWDEIHNVGLSSYRHEAMANGLRVIESYDWQRVITMTGTPVEAPLEVLEDFTHVRILSTPRKQKARVSFWKSDEDEPKGNREDSAAAAVLQARQDEPDKPVLVFYDNKAGIGRLFAKLKARGLQRGLYYLTSDNKYQEIGDTVIKRETLPEDCTVLAFTSVFVESCNLYADVSRLICIDRKHDAHYQQAVARTRGAAIPLVELLTTGRDGGYSFDTNKDIAFHNSQALGFADLYNAQEARQAHKWNNAQTY